YRADGDACAAVVADLRAAGRRGLALRADSADLGAVRAAVDRSAAELGRLDVLVSSAGVFPHGPLEDVSLEEARTTMAVHALAPFVAAQAAAAHLPAGGRVIAIGSCFAERVPYAGVSLYAMSKAALTGMAKGLARDLGPRGITVCVVHPGSTDTDMNPADAPEAEAERAHIALGRYAAPEEVAATVVALAGPAGAYVTGASIAVDGGFAA
ncbi:MAG TPA: SDR family oxidoreductase, partial [Capillimicrobium sp.]